MFAVNTVLTYIFCVHVCGCVWSFCLVSRQTGWKRDRVRREWESSWPYMVKPHFTASSVPRGLSHTLKTSHHATRVCVCVSGHISSKAGLLNLVLRWCFSRNMQKDNSKTKQTSHQRCSRLFVEKNNIKRYNWFSTACHWGPAGSKCTQIPQKQISLFLQQREGKQTAIEMIIVSNSLRILYCSEIFTCIEWVMFAVQLTGYF